jgi:hypothetical protein
MVSGRAEGPIHSNTILSHVSDLQPSLNAHINTHGVAMD